MSEEAKENECKALRARADNLRIMQTATGLGAMLLPIATIGTYYAFWRSKATREDRDGVEYSLTTTQKVTIAVLALLSLMSIIGALVFTTQFKNAKNSLVYCQWKYRLD